MTTSNESTLPTPNLPTGGWQELTDRISVRSSREFSEWMDKQLEKLESEFQQFTTPGSLRKSLGR